MIAFIASTHISTSGLILCSLSPYFKEDIAKVKNKTFSSLMTRRYADFAKHHSATLAKQIKAKQVVLLYGRKETRSLIKRVTETFVQIPLNHKHLISINKTKHNIGDKRYLHTIHEASRNLI